VSIEYSSPRVTLKGDNRRGKIWGQLIKAIEAGKKID
jgi:hypothetical protein